MTCIVTIIFKSSLVSVLFIEIWEGKFVYIE